MTFTRIVIANMFVSVTVIQDIGSQVKKRLKLLAWLEWNQEINKQTNIPTNK